MYLWQEAGKTVLVSCITGGSIHRKSHILSTNCYPGANSSCSFLAKLFGHDARSWSTELPSGFLCDAHTQHIQLCTKFLSCTCLKWRFEKYKGGKSEGEKEKSPSAPALLISHPQPAARVRSLCTTHGLFCSHHTTCLYIFHDFWHRSNNTGGLNVDTTAVNE